ncbi:hypothetical protein Tco_0836118 [Tanacetum coccineum]
MSQPANDDYSQHLSDDEASYHEDASDNGTATNKPKQQQQQQLTPTTTTISNIKLPILKKEEYDIWAMEMEHYLEYIDNDVWKVIHNGNSKKRISTGKDGVVRILPPVSAAEIHVVEKERKAKNHLTLFDDGVVNWGEHTIEEEETNHALMIISSNTELGEQEAKILAYTLAVKKLEAQIVTFQKQQLSLNEQLTFQANEIYAKDEKLKRYRRIGMKAVKEKEQLQENIRIQ